MPCAAAVLLSLALLAPPPPQPPRPSAAPRGAAPERWLPFPVTERTLPNGLRVIAVTGLPGPVAVHLAVRTGSRYEVEPGRSGFAHLFEHLMFRGTRATPAARYQAEIARLGVQQNAYTSEDVTVFHGTLAEDDLDAYLALEADRFMNLEVGVDAFRSEARAVLGEYDKDAANPGTRLEEALRAAAFKVHPYRHTVAGFLADIEDMPNQHEHARVFFARWYRPERTTLVVAGDVPAARIFALAERRFGRWRPGAGDAVQVPEEPPPSGPVQAHVPWPVPTLPLVAVAFRGPAFSDVRPDWLAARAILDLELGETSDLRRRLVDEEQVADDLSVDASPSLDPNLFTVTARVRRVEDVARVRDAILRAAARAAASPPDPRRLADHLAWARHSLQRALDTADAMAGLLARWSAVDRTSATLERAYRALAALRPEDFHAASARLFTDANLTVATLAHGPLPEDAAAPPPHLARLAPPPPAADLPVLAVPSPHAFLTLELRFQAGSARDPEGKAGLAAVAAAMVVDAGSRRLRREEVRAALFPLAASFTALADKEVVTFTGAFPRDAWERFLEVALPQLTDPGFREEDFRRVREEARAALVQDLRASSEEELAKERLQASLFAGTPYGHPVQGTEAGLDALTLDDVRAFVRARYVQADLTVAVGGDAPAGLVPALRRALAALPVGEAPPGLLPAARRPRGLEVEIVEREARGTALSLGHPLEVVRGHPDFVALWLARSWLGEHRSASSHLYQRLREARGLNYGAYAYVEAFPRGMRLTAPEPGVPRRAQLFELWLRPVAPRNAVMALRLALLELRRLVAEGLTEAQFEATRGALLRALPQLGARPEDRVGQALDARFYGTPELAAYLRAGLRALTCDAVNAAIRRHLSGDDLAVVAVTADGKALAEALRSGAASSIAYDTAQPPELLEEDRRAGALDLGLGPGAVRVTPAAEVFAR